MTIGYLVNVEGVVKRDGEYLFVERAPEEEHAAGVMAFPGGKVEQVSDGADPIEQTARRELAEEVDLDVTSVEYLHSRTFGMDTGRECLNIITSCENAGGQAIPKADDEVASVQWPGSDTIYTHQDIPDYVKRDFRRIAR